MAATSTSAQNYGVYTEENWDVEEYCGVISNKRANASQIGKYEDTQSDINGSLSIRVCRKSIGKLIGVKGSNIKDLQRTTRTKISVGKDNYRGKVTVTIYGSPSAQIKCKNLIEELTGDLEPSEVQSLETEVKSHNEVKEREYTFPVINWDEINKLADEHYKLKWSSVPQIKKNFYIEHPRVQSMSENYVVKLRKSLNNINVSYVFSDVNEPIPKPVETFEEAFHNYPEILAEIQKKEFTKPFPIQAQAWPILLSGKDMIGIAQTGTGKTLAFLIPAVIHTYGQEVPMSERGGPNVLVLAPTRELALQIESEVHKYSYRGIKSVCIYGGGNRKAQVNEVTEGVQIVIATPGRLNDLVKNKIINLMSVTFLVLDEADRMLDLGFEPQIRKILIDIRPDRQTVMTSATWPIAIQDLARKYMEDPIQVVVGSLDLAAVHTVHQTILIVDEDEKEKRMMEVISRMKNDDKLIIFVDKKALADGISSDLALKRIDCDSIHGDREQCDREQAIDEFKNGNVKILIATDVASRGIDIVDVTIVLNYDFPRNIEEYVHRVGRTGRAGKTGKAITFFTRYDWSYAKELIKILEEANQEVPHELYGMRDRYEISRRRRNSKKPGRSRDGGEYDAGNAFGPTKGFKW